MKIWNTLVCVWIGVIHGAMQVNSELVLTSSPITARNGERFTLICSITPGSVINMAWLQNNTLKVITQMTNNCSKQPPPIGSNNINRFSESCNDTVHSIEFRFNSTTDQGGWQCGKPVTDTYIYPRSNIHSVVVASPVMSTQTSSTTTRYMETTSESGTVTSQKGQLVLTSSPLSATDGKPFTLICSVSSGSLVNIVWLQNNTTKVITQVSNSCTKQPPAMGNNINRFSVSCSDTVHSIEFGFNSNTDQGGWQCGKLEKNNHIYPRSNIHNIGVSSPVTSTQSSPTTTRYMETTFEPWTVTPQEGVASPVTSTESSSTTTRYMETTSEPGTVTSRKASTDESDSNTTYIAVGAVGGAVLLAVSVVGIVCIRRRTQADHHQNDMKEESNAEARPVYQNTVSCHTDSSAAVMKPEKTQQDDPIVSEDVNTQNMYGSLTSVEMHIYRRLK